MVEDQYKTIVEETIGEGYYTEKRSKFLAFAHHIESVDEAKELVITYRKQYYDARHCCYAYMLGPEQKVFRANDDGEPSSTAGKPILGQIISHELTDVIVFVIRYFGGVKLGTSGLINAYRTAANEALSNASVVVKLIEETIDFDFTYPMMNDVMRVVKEMQPRVIDQKFDNTCSIKLSIRKSEAEQLRMRLNKLSFEG
ncbi:MAG: YigZ family protein [Prevotella salivae]|nr:YigZ family protein [Segatella salivae]